MALTDAACRAAKKAAKAYKLKAYKLTDAGGLFLLVDPGGSRLWRHAYRFGGKQKTIALGIYPHVSLAAARDARDANKRMLAAGVDPSEKRKADKQAAVVAHLTTFDRIADGENHHAGTAVRVREILPRQRRFALRPVQDDHGRLARAGAGRVDDG